MDDIKKNQNITDLVAKGEQIYKQKIVEAGKEKELIGQYIAVEVSSENIFIATTKEEVLRDASSRHPSKLFYVRRIGSLDAVSSRTLATLRS